MLGSVLGKILGGGVAEPIEAIGGVLDKLFTSDEERLDKQAVLARLAQRPGELQAAINKIEARHRSIFVAGWRPFIGWVCGAGIAWAYIGQPLFEWVVAIWWPDRGIVPPVIVTDHLFELVVAMLGMGGLRTLEKFGGRTK
jgi:hypothetical protein